jgi:hypothetical protein
MEIKQLSETSLIIKGKKNSLLLNTTGEVGKQNVRLVVATGEGSISHFEGEETVVIAAPGEYEVGGIEVNGVGLNGKSAYVMTVDGIVVGYIPSGDYEMSEKKEEKLKAADILTGEVSKGDSKRLWTMAKKLGVNVVIPLGDKEGIAEFLDEADVEGAEAVENVKYGTRADLPESLEVKYLKW